MYVVLEAMSDAGVLAGLPRAAAQDMAIHTMLVCLVWRTHKSLSIHSSVQFRLCEKTMCMVTVVHCC